MTLAEVPKKEEEASSGKQDGTCRVQANRFSGRGMTVSEKKKEQLSSNFSVSQQPTGSDTEGYPTEKGC